MTNELRKHYPLPVNFELYVKCMKSIVQSTLFPHEFVSELLRIIDFEVVRAAEPPELQPPPTELPKQVRSSKLQKTKIEVWQKALSKLPNSESAVQAKL